MKGEEVEGDIVPFLVPRTHQQVNKLFARVYALVECHFQSLNVSQAITPPPPPPRTPFPLQIPQLHAALGVHQLPDAFLRRQRPGQNILDRVDDGERPFALVRPVGLLDELHQGKGRRVAFGDLRVGWVGGWVRWVGGRVNDNNNCQPTSVMESRMSWIASPFPTRSPKERLRDRGPKHVPKVSPTPLRPVSVEGRAPKNKASFCTSLTPRVTTAAAAFMPSPRPEHMPAAMAMTFLTAPPTSTPMTSPEVKTRK